MRKNLKRIKNKILFLGMALVMVACGQKNEQSPYPPLNDRPIVQYIELSSSWTNDFENITFTADRNYVLPKIIDQYSPVLSYPLELTINDVLVCTFVRDTDGWYKQYTQCPKYLKQGDTLAIRNLSYKTIVILQLSVILPDYMQ